MVGMSTLALVNLSRAELIVFGAATALAVALLLAFRVQRPSLVRGPARWFPGAPVKPWALIVLLGIIAWLLLQAFCGTAIMLSRKARGGEISPDTAFAPGEIAVIAIVPPIIVAFAMIQAMATLPSAARPRLGLELSGLGTAVLAALAGALVMIPLVTWSQIASERVYEILQYQHPTEHELLEQMSQSSPPARAALIFAAVVVAPFFEEILFRGGIQTVLRRVFGDGAVGAWAAIGVTSIVFAMFHPMWMAPGILAVSICLGYVYERTGNLWAAILMHAAFNAVNTLLFLFTR